MDDEKKRSSKKRRQTFLSDSARKQAKRARDIVRTRTIVYSKSFAEQWFEIKSRHGLITDEDTAGYFINRSVTCHFQREGNVSNFCECDHNHGRSTMITLSYYNRESNLYILTA